MKKLSFKEYYESKTQLLKASENIPKVINEYLVKKYCKIPVIINEEKEFISLKPKDVIKILWEFNQGVPTAKNIIIESDDCTETYYKPQWSDNKLQNWITLTTFEKQQ